MYFIFKVSTKESLNVVNALFLSVIAKCKMQRNDLIEPEEGGGQKEAN